MTYPKYPTYRETESGILGAIPEHWDVKRLKFCLNRVAQAGEGRDNLIELEDIEGWTGRRLQSANKEANNGILFQEGDILFGKLRPYLAKVYLAEESGVAIGDFHVLRPVKSAKSKYASRILERSAIS